MKARQELVLVATVLTFLAAGRIADAVGCGYDSQCDSNVDFDCDCITDDIESTLLTTLAPVIRVDGEEGDKHILPIDWYVEHCKLMLYDPATGDLVGDTGNNLQLTTSIVLGIIEAYDLQGLDYEYRLTFKDHDHRFGHDPQDPMTWSRAEAEGRGIYGRVSPNPDPGNSQFYRVQYFFALGWNETDTPPFCNAGNHEGDWMSVDFDVEAVDPSRPRIIRAIYHNHGRQAFVESASALDFQGSHPIVYIERGTNETWPFAAVAGFCERDKGPTARAKKPATSTLVAGFVP